MKLSEAIRLGAMMGPQTFGHSFDGVGGSCAHGAAMLASGKIPAQSWPWIMTTFPTCPGCKVGHMLSNALVCLNDNHHWTREQIADWVATIEPAEVKDSRDEREGLEGQGPIGPSLEVETAETKTILI